MKRSTLFVRPSVTAAILSALGLALPASSFPPPGILAHWDFDQVGSSVALDSVSGLNGTLAGGAAMVAGGVSGGALQLSSATGSLVNMGSILPLTGNQPCTFTAWVKITGNPAAFQVVLSRHTAGTLNGHFMAVNTSACYGAAGMAFSYRSSACGQEAISSSTVNDGLWHFVAYTYHPNSGMRLYVDGGPPEAIVGGTAVAANTASFLVGGLMVGATPTAAFDGLIDDVQVYGRALTCWELNALFTAPGSEAGSPADLNGDGVVDGADIGILLANWGTPACDLNGDGIVNGADLGVLLAQWGSC